MEMLPGYLQHANGMMQRCEIPQYFWNDDNEVRLVMWNGEMFLIAADARKYRGLPVYRHAAAPIVFVEEPAQPVQPETV